MRERQAWIWKAGAECLGLAAVSQEPLTDSMFPYLREYRLGGLRDQAQELPAAYIYPGERRKSVGRALCQTLCATLLLGPDLLNPAEQRE